MYILYPTCTGNGRGEARYVSRYCKSGEKGLLCTSQRDNLSSLTWAIISVPDVVITRLAWHGMPRLENQEQPLTVLT